MSEKPVDEHASAQTIGASLGASHPAYIVDDDDADRLTATQFAIAAGLRVRQFSGGRQVLDVLDRLEPGIFLLDVMMPDVTGPDVLDAIARRDGNNAVIMMSAHADVGTAVSAMRRGAHDFLLKPLSALEMRTTLERAAGLLQNDIDEATRSLETAQKLATITPKEMVVLRKLVAGKRNKTVAYELGVSERTVEVHRSRLIKRVEAGTFAGLIAFAVKAGVEPDTTE